MQLLCDSYIKLILKLTYFDSHFLFLRAKDYNPVKATIYSSMCVSIDNPVPQSSLQEIFFSKPMKIQKHWVGRG